LHSLIQVGTDGRIYIYIYIYIYILTKINLLNKLFLSSSRLVGKRYLTIKYLTDVLLLIVLAHSEVLILLREKWICTYNIK
jgi:hypothetical protein